MSKAALLPEKSAGEVAGFITAAGEVVLARRWILSPATWKLTLRLRDALHAKTVNSLLEQLVRREALRLGITDK